VRTQVTSREPRKDPKAHTTYPRITRDVALHEVGDNADTELISEPEACATSPSAGREREPRRSYLKPTTFIVHSKHSLPTRSLLACADAARNCKGCLGFCEFTRLVVGDTKHNVAAAKLDPSQLMRTDS
jgi:hypothetical protein